MRVSGYGARARGQALNELHLLCCRSLVAVSVADRFHVLADVS